MRRSKKNERVEITYKFTLPGKPDFQHTVTLDNCGNLVQSDEGGEPPEWARLEFCQCRLCPLKTSETEFCPPARSMSEMMSVFSEIASFEVTEAEIIMPNRTIKREISAQEGLRSLLGLVMATSGCPIVGKLKPMGRFHLPFADGLETLYRAISMYLTAQFIRHLEGETAEWSLSGLEEIYREIHLVNQDFSDRLREATHRESILNGIAILDALAQMGGAANALAIGKLKPLFSMYLSDPDE